MEEPYQEDSSTGTMKGYGVPILVVDDEEGIRTVLVRIFSALGFQVSQATNGHEALDLISKQPFRIVVTDFQMPGMDGCALASRIKNASPKTGIIMITGSDKGTVQKRQGQECVDFVLFKPFIMEDVCDTVQAALSLGLVPSVTTGIGSDAQTKGMKNGMEVRFHPS